MQPKCKIIALTGNIHSGKDTVADYIGRKYGFMKAGFADPLKYVCAELFLENPAGFFSEKGKTEVMPFWGITRRAALQFVGTELVRDHMAKLTHPNLDTTFGNVNDHWIRCMEKRINQDNITYLVINDLRFQNEANWVHATGGHIIYMWRTQVGVEAKEAGIKNHSSEAGIDLYKYNGERIYPCENNDTIDSLYRSIDVIMRLILNITN